jgi:hypothetical protein
MTQTEQFKNDLIGLADFAYNRLRSRVEGLTDDEYFWEPAPGCWSIRPDAEGKLRRDGASLPIKPAPLTTIAWRLTHIIDGLAGERNATWIGVTPTGSLGIDGEAASAAEAVDQLERAYALFRGHVAAADADKLSVPMGEIAGPYADDTRAAFVLHELDELIHHGAEVAALRDLYHATRPVAPIVDACRRGDLATVETLLNGDPALRDQHPDLVAQRASAQDWDTVRYLVEHGFGVNESAGVTALHYAAGIGRLDVVDLLLKHDADATAVDTEFGKTPAEWAEYLGHDDIAKRLTDAAS